MKKVLWNSKKFCDSAALCGTLPDSVKWRFGDGAFGALLSSVRKKTLSTLPLSTLKLWAAAAKNSAENYLKMFHDEYFRVKLSMRKIPPKNVRCTCRLNW
jgi:hypothetical protein